MAIDKPPVDLWAQVASVKLFGFNLTSIKLPQALAGTASVVVLFDLVRRSFGWTAGLACAVLPRMTNIGAEARSYAFSAAIAAWLTLIFLVARSRPDRRRWWVAYAALLAVGIYVFLYLALLALAHAVAIALGAQRREGLRTWVKATAGAVIVSSPLIVFGIAERNQIGYLARRTEVTPNTVLVTIWLGQPLFAVVGWVLIALGLVVRAGKAPADRRKVERSLLGLYALGLVAVGIRWRRARRRGDSTDVVVTASWFLVPSIVLIGTSPVMAVFTARYLAFCSPAVALLIGFGIVALARRWRPAAALATAAVVLAALPAWGAQRTPYAQNNSDWAQISARMATVASRGDAVVFDEGVRPSRRTRLAERTYPTGFAGLRDVTLRQPYWQSASWHDTAYSVAQAADLGRFSTVTQVWLVEYAIGSSVDRYGVADLRSIGFVEGRSFATHRSRIIEFTREGAGAPTIGRNS